METQNRIKEVETEMESLDGRSKQYKELKAELEELQSEENTIQEVEKNQSKVPTETYDTVVSFNGRVPSEKIKWLFTEYNSIFGTTFKQCLCAGKIKKMVAKIKGTYETENNLR